MAAGGVALLPGEYELKLTAADPDSTIALPGTSGLISLDTSVTAELAAEGTARDVVRVIQQARKDAGLAVSDRITLSVGADAAVADAVRAHADFIAGETLATAVRVLPAADPAFAGTTAAPAPVGENGEVRVQVARVARSCGIARPRANTGPVRSWPGHSGVVTYAQVTLPRLPGSVPLGSGW